MWPYFHFCSPCFCTSLDICLPSWFIISWLAFPVFLSQLIDTEDQLHISIGLVRSNYVLLHCIFLVKLKKKKKKSNLNHLFNLMLFSDFQKRISCRHCQHQLLSLLLSLSLFVFNYFSFRDSNTICIFLKSACLTIPFNYIFIYLVLNVIRFANTYHALAAYIRQNGV